jgi:cell wall-associated NlpC family hydrolase
MMSKPPTIRLLRFLGTLVVTLALVAGNCLPVSAAAKKKKSTDDDDDDATPKPKAKSTPALNLPLPTKSPAGATPRKKSEAKETPAPDNADKTDKPEKPAADAKGKGEHAPNATVEPEQIAEFAAQPARIQQLIRDAVDLTRLNLTYTFGSADPDKGGMDCSGTIYYLLQAHNFNDVPRDSAGQYLWARRGNFFPVLSKSADSPEFKDLLPGDLMFWTGTYETGRDIPVSHVMMYLGREKGSGRRIMFGSSDGRSYNGIQRWGVSVFDFKMPKTDAGGEGEKAKAEFVGYARIPGLRSSAPPPAAEEDTTGAKKETAATTPVPDKERKSASTPRSTPRKKKKPVSDD